MKKRLDQGEFLSSIDRHMKTIREIAGENYMDLALTPFFDFANLWQSPSVPDILASVRPSAPPMAPSGYVGKLRVNLALLALALVSMWTVVVSIKRLLWWFARSNSNTQAHAFLEPLQVLVLEFPSPNGLMPGPHLSGLKQTLLDSGSNAHTMLVSTPSLPPKPGSHCLDLSSLLTCKEYAHTLGRVFLKLASNGRKTANSISKLALSPADLFRFSVITFNNCHGLNAIDSELFKRAFEKVKSKTPNLRAVIYPMENQHWERILCLIFSNSTVRKIGVVHSLPGPWDLRYTRRIREAGPYGDLVSPSAITCNNISHKGMLQKIHEWSVPIYLTSRLRDDDLNIQTTGLERSGTINNIGLALSYSEVYSKELIARARRVFGSTKGGKHGFIRKHPYGKLGIPSLISIYRLGFEISPEKISQFFDSIDVLIADENSNVLWQALDWGKGVLVEPDVARRILEVGRFRIVGDSIGGLKQVQAELVGDNRPQDADHIPNPIWSEWKKIIGS